jgi:hypothetical protein
MTYSAVQRTRVFLRSRDCQVRWRQVREATDARKREPDVYEDAAASALATSLSADAFEDLLVMELAMRSASARSRAARPGSVAATTFATPLSADAFRTRR